jgi:hypothetical protein
MQEFVELDSKANTSEQNPNLSPVVKVEATSEIHSNTDEGSESDSSSDGYLTFSDSDEEDDDDDESQMTDVERQEERRLREIERQKVLEAAGLIVKQASEDRLASSTRLIRRPSKKAPPARPSRTPVTANVNEDLSTKPTKERELPPLPPSSPATATRTLDDAFERYAAFKVEQGNTMAENGGNNRLSVISNPSTYASTVPPSSPRQSISTRPPSATFPTSPSVHSTESKISSFLHYLGGRIRTPGEGVSSNGTTDRKTSTSAISAPIISAPMALPSPSRENSPAFGSVGIGVLGRYSI